MRRSFEARERRVELHWKTQLREAAIDLPERSTTYYNPQRSAVAERR